MSAPTARTRTSCAGSYAPGKKPMGVRTAQQPRQQPKVFGRGLSASGGAHLVGSLTGLPYALAQIEQDFLVPENIQSLIWSDLVPGLMTSAVLPRWWNVTPEGLRAAALYQQSGEEILIAAAADAALRKQVMEILFDCMMPQRWATVDRALAAGRPDILIQHLMPAEAFY